MCRNEFDLWLMVREKLQYHFTNLELLVVACSYTSYRHKGKALKCSRRKKEVRSHILEMGWQLETIGDGVLLLIVRQKIISLAPLGNIHKIVNDVVSNKNLQTCAKALGFPDVIESAGNVEALIGAVWIDSRENIHRTREVVECVIRLGDLNFKNLGM